MMDESENGLSHELISLCQINKHATHINFYLWYFVLLTKHNICDLNAMSRFRFECDEKKAEFTTNIQMIFK